MRRKNHYLIIIFKIFLVFCYYFHNSQILSENNYSSEDGGLIFENSNKISDKLYYRWHINKLSRAIKPKYIRFLDISSYSHGIPLLIKGVLFTYRAPFAKRVKIAGNFTNWETKNLKKNENGVWYTIIPVGTEFQKDRLLFEYKFNIDGLWDYDHENKNTRSDTLGSYFSIFKIPVKIEDIKKNVTIRMLPIHLEANKDKILYEFRIYRPNALSVSLVGNFNHWNPDHDPAKKDSNGIWRIRISLNKGEYLYKFAVDGKWLLDNDNPSVKLDPVTNIKASYFEVK